jgi:hypothetical protein
MIGMDVYAGFASVKTATKKRSKAASCFGSIRSCGCLAREVRAQLCKTREHIAAITTHGHACYGTVTTEYRSWEGMLGRCHNKNHRDYKNWGGRGIAVCDRWRFGENGKSGFECFLEDMGLKPSPKHSIDRWPNNDGNYEHGNCRWVTEEEQQNNRRSNIIIAFDSDTLTGVMTLAQWERKIGWRGGRLSRRLRNASRLRSRMRGTDTSSFREISERESTPMVVCNADSGNGE